MGLGQKHLIEQQIPAHIREASPLFTKFLQYYYEFQDTLGISKAIQDILDSNNVEKADAEFVRSFFEELKILPYDIVADTKLVAQHIYDLYEAKGSERAVKLLFQIVFGERVSVSYPSDQMLRASDGKWKRDSFLTLQTLEGQIQESSNRVVFSGNSGRFSFAIDSVEYLEDSVSRVSFTTNLPYSVDGVERVFVYTNDVLDFTGTLLDMPSVIQVEDGGARWQLGQIIVLPGSVKDTIVQVKRINSGGEIKKVEVVQYGHGYGTDPVFVISPYPYKPNDSYVEQFSEKISDVPLAYAHTVNVFDLMSGLGESVLGLDSNQEYILEGYVLQDYINRRSIVQTYYTDGNAAFENDEITIEEWLESRARIRIIRNKTATSAGYYENSDGMLSVPEIRLQDSYFYQIFSYVIETAQSLKTYGSILGKIHPAGFKYFSNLTKIADISIDATSARILSRETVFTTDGVEVTDPTTGFIKTMHVPFSDIAKATDIDVANNYDANNELEYYDPSLDGDWDVIDQSVLEQPYIAEFDAENYDVPPDAEILVDPPYDMENYDSENYGASEDTVDQYTREDTAINIQKN